MSKKALKGFANLKAFPLSANNATTYTPGEMMALVGAQSCEREDNRNEYSIKADDDIYDTVSDFEKTELTVKVAEAELSQLSSFIGATYDADTQEMDEKTIDTPPEFALTFSGLRADGGYRLFRYYCAKLVKYKHSLTTRGQNNDVSSYELTFACVGRKYDQKLRTTKDIDVPQSGTIDISWLNSVGPVPSAT